MSSADSPTANGTAKADDAGADHDAVMAAANGGDGGGASAAPTTDAAATTAAEAPPRKRARKAAARRGSYGGQGAGEADDDDADESYDPAFLDEIAKKRVQAKAAKRGKTVDKATHDEMLTTLMRKAAEYSTFMQEELLEETVAAGGASRKLTLKTESDFTVPHMLSKCGGELRDYQLEACHWLAGLFANGVNGILGDEMGLGKTIVTIAFLAYLWESNMQGPFLIVAPLSTLSNWMNEFAKWAPDIPTLLYHGSQAERKLLQKEFEMLATLTTAKKMGGGGGGGSGVRSGSGLLGSAAEKLKSALDRPGMSSYTRGPAVITSYDVTIRDTAWLQKISFRFLVVDEAHRLKNFNCRLIRELRTVTALNRLLLTGTPLQNSMSELWSLLNFCMPDVFDSLENFQTVFDFSSVVAGDESEEAAAEEGEGGDTTTTTTTSTTTSTTTTAADGAAAAADCSTPTPRSAADEKMIAEKKEIVEKLHQILKPFFLRRLKADMNLGIPAKREIVLYAGMTPVQRRWYEMIRSGKADDELRALNNGKRMKLANRLMQLRKVCNHPMLFDAAFDAFYELFKAGKQVEVPSDEVEGSVRARSAVSYAEEPDTKEAEEEYLAGLIAEAEAEEEERARAAVAAKAAKAAAADVPVELTAEQRAREAYELFASERRHTVAATTAVAHEQQRLLAVQWAALSDDERQTYQTRADEGRERQRAAAKVRANAGNVVLRTKAYEEQICASCGKFELLAKMLPTLIAAQHKVLVFSQMTRMLDILQDFMEVKGWPCVRIDGTTSQPDRQQAIDTYNGDARIKVFLLSTKAGGLGINLTSADTVIIYDSDWNPQSDLQAQDRAHRIGQTKPVVVYRLCTPQSVESAVLRRATDKLKLEMLVIAKGDFQSQSARTLLGATGGGRGRPKNFLTADDIKEVMAMDEGKANASMGHERPITDGGLARVLNRELVMQLTDPSKPIDARTAGEGFEVMEEIKLGF